MYFFSDSPKVYTSKVEGILHGGKSVTLHEDERVLLNGWSLQVVTNKFEVTGLKNDSEEMYPY